MLERLLGLALVLILPSHLIVVAHRDVIAHEFEVFAGRMHPLEVVE